MAGKFSRVASEEILREAETIALLNNKENAAGNYYAKFCRILADAVFVVVAILWIIIIRQVLAAQGGIIKNAVNLEKSRHKINALIFNDVQLLPQETPLEKARRKILMLIFCGPRPPSPIMNLFLTTQT